MDARVSSKVSEVQSWVDRNPGKRAQVCLSFYERRQHHGWFARQEQRLTWEQWRLPLEVAPSHAALQELNALEAESARATQRQALQTALEDCLTRIVAAVNERRDHIPPVVADAPLTFPFDIEVAPTPAQGPGASLFGADIVRRMLSSTQPPSVLH